ncbi:hypothetical protein HOY80DRAFT_313558 [Tuber brumale]|nr:hypothetical protein HOY80DRAFT_313558 [Tuber brumale]
MSPVCFYISSFLCSVGVVFVPRYQAQPNYRYVPGPNPYHVRSALFWRMKSLLISVVLPGKRVLCLCMICIINPNRGAAMPIGYFTYTLLLKVVITKK